MDLRRGSFEDLDETRVVKRLVEAAVESGLDRPGAHVWLTRLAGRDSHGGECWIFVIKSKLEFAHERVPIFGVRRDSSEHRSERLLGLVARFDYEHANPSEGATATRWRITVRQTNVSYGPHMVVTPRPARASPVYRDPPGITSEFRAIVAD